MCISPGPFPGRTITGQCWPGGSAREHLAAEGLVWAKSGKIDYAPGFVLYFGPRVGLSPRKLPLVRVYLVKKAQINFFGTEATMAAA